MSQADDEDDYLANIDKFLLDSSSAAAPKPKTYSQIRKEAAKQAQLKNERNKVKGRRQREVEARTEGLSKSLFERAKEEEDAGLVKSNKALAIMMKMGFKPGQALGKTDDDAAPDPPKPVSEVLAGPGPGPPPTHEREQPVAGPSSPAPPAAATHKTQHKVEPLPINEWAGKRGIGLGVKRAPSPTAAERVAKMARMAAAADTDADTFRDRARREYEERRAEGRLAPAQRTCAVLDEKAGKAFNVLWLNPAAPESWPAGLAAALDLRTTLEIAPNLNQRNPDRLRRQMAADSLRPLGLDDDDGDGDGDDSEAATATRFPPDVLDETTHFLRLHAPDRLELVLGYLRDSYAYCFWCGTQYDGDEDLRAGCPGADEAAHD